MSVTANSDAVHDRIERVLQALERSCRLVEQDAAVTVLRKSPVSVGRIPERIREIVNECLSAHGLSSSAHLASLVKASSRKPLGDEKETSYRLQRKGGKYLLNEVSFDASQLALKDRVSAKSSSSVAGDSTTFYSETTSDISLLEEKALLQKELLRAKKKLLKLAEDKEALGDKYIAVSEKIEEVAKISDRERQAKEQLSVMQKCVEEAVTELQEKELSHAQQIGAYHTAQQKHAQLVNQLQTKCVRYKARVAELDSRLSDQANKLGCAEQQLAETQAKLESFVNQSSELALVICTLQEQKDVISHLQDRRQSVEGRLQQEMTARQDAISKLETLAAERADAAEKLLVSAEVEKENIALQEQVSRFSSVAENVRSTKHEVHVLHSAVQRELQEVNSSIQHNFSRLLTTATQWQKQKEQEVAELHNEKIETMKSLQEQSRTDFQQAEKEWNARLSHLQQSSKQAECAAEAARNELTSSQQNLREAEEANAILSTEMRSLQQEFASERRISASLRQQLTSLHTSLNSLTHLMEQTDSGMSPSSVTAVDSAEDAATLPVTIATGKTSWEVLSKFQQLVVESSRLKSEFHQSQQLLIEVQADNRTLRAANQALEQELQTSSAAVESEKNLHAHTAALHKELASFQQAKISADAKATRLTRQLSLQTSKVEQLESEKKALVQKCDHLQESNSRLAEQQAESRAERQKAEAECVKHCEALLDAETKAARVEEAHAQVVREAQTKIKYFEECLRQSESRSQQDHVSFTQLHAQLAENQLQKERLATDAKQLETLLSDTQAKATMAEAALADVNDRLISAEAKQQATVADLELKVEESQTCLLETEARCEGLDIKLLSARAENEAMVAELEAAHAEQAALKSQAVSESSRAAKLEDQLAALKAAVEKEAVGERQRRSKEQRDWQARQEQLVARAEELEGLLSTATAECKLQEGAARKASEKVASMEKERQAALQKCESSLAAWQMAAANIEKEAEEHACQLQETHLAEIENLRLQLSEACEYRTALTQMYKSLFSQEAPNIGCVSVDVDYSSSQESASLLSSSSESDRMTPPGVSLAKSIKDLFDKLLLENRALREQLIKKQESASREMNRLSEQLSEVEGQLKVAREQLTSSLQVESERLRRLNDEQANTRQQLEMFQSKYEETMGKLRASESLVENSKQELLLERNKAGHSKQELQMLRRRCKALEDSHAARTLHMEASTTRQLTELESLLAAEQSAKEQESKRCQQLTDALESSEEEKRIALEQVEHIREALIHQQNTGTEAERVFDEIAAVMNETVNESGTGEASRERLHLLLSHADSKGLKLRSVILAVSQLLEERDEIQSCFSECETRLTNAQQEITALQAARIVAEKTLAEQHQAFADNSAQSASLRVRVQALEEQLKVLAAEHQSTTAVLAVTKASNEQAQAGLAKVRGLLKESERTKADLVESSTALKEEVSLWRHRYEELLHSASAKDRELDIAKDSLREADKMRQTISRLEESVRAAEVRRDKAGLANEQIQQLLGNLANVEAEKTALQSDLQRLRSRADDDRSEREQQLQEQLRQRSGEIDRVHANLSKVMQEKKALFEELQDVKHEHQRSSQKEHAELKRDLAQVQAQMAEVISERDQLAREREEMRTEMTEQRYGQEEEAGQRESILAELVESRLRVAHLEQAMKTLSSKHKSLLEEKFHSFSPTLSPRVQNVRDDSFMSVVGDRLGSSAEQTIPLMSIDAGLPKARGDQAFPLDEMGTQELKEALVAEKNHHAVFRANALWEKSEKEKLQQRLKEAERQLRELRNRPTDNEHFAAVPEGENSSTTSLLEEKLSLAEDRASELQDQVLLLSEQNSKLLQKSLHQRRCIDDLTRKTHESQGIHAVMRESLTSVTSSRVIGSQSFQLLADSLDQSAARLLTNSPRPMNRHDTEIPLSNTSHVLHSTPRLHSSLTLDNDNTELDFTSP